MPGCRRMIIRQTSRCNMAERNNRVSDGTLDAGDFVFAGCEAGTHNRHITGARYGDLSTSYADSTGRRIACRTRCTKMVFANIDDLRSGAETSCGCSRPSLEHRLQLREMAIVRQRTIDFNIARAR
jgi:hypothetical protein